MKTISLQDAFLTAVYDEKVPVILSMSNGFQCRGMVVGFDAFTLLLETEDKQILVYKHSISSITPSKKMHIVFDVEKCEL